MSLVNNFVSLFVESAPWLMLGLLIAGLIKQLVPEKWLQRHLSGSGFKPVMKGALIGAPLPLCSCGVIPAAVGLRRAGASKASTTSFLVATPETGVDSVSLTYAMMGPVMAIVRPIAAISTAVTAGLLVHLTDKNQSEKSEKVNASQTSSCCSSAKVEAEPTTSSCCSSEVTTPEAKPGCCSSKKSQARRKPSLISRLTDSVRYASFKLLPDISHWLLIGLGFAALVQTFVPPSMMTSFGQGVFGMLLMVLISIPVYVCATASTPIAAGLMLAGVSPGAALVFMLAGPATNLSTLGSMRNELGNRAIAIYLVSVIVCAMVAGLLLDALVPGLGQQLRAVAAEHQHTGWWEIALAVLLAGLIGYNGVSKYLKRPEQSPKVKEVN